jgi:hypothetical protein
MHNNNVQIILLELKITEPFPIFTFGCKIDLEIENSKNEIDQREKLLQQ